MKHGTRYTRKELKISETESTDIPVNELRNCNKERGERENSCNINCHKKENKN